ncbi:MAG TPA: ABC transporter ATP-binding protein [Rectinema sp.]|mgnify:CR=1 FL=1|jgi:iron complex transport system ATP-binding protein|nr:ABC transporter ATP-binding protein [Spirochaetia bacterium]HOD58959.1 ABC transporter ATP-binding protein [Rectinema sp.]HQB07898.1 ABC transporter ATP-binding protein [Rectinema sp.]
MNSESVLSARDISFRWKEDQPLLEDISLDVARGQTLAILGPNGAGKTTLLSILSGRLSPRAGSVNLDSRPLISYSARERSRLIAFLPQLEKLAFNYRVLDFVLMGRTPCMEVLALPGKEDEEAALKALSLFGLDSFSMRNIGELSGGEFQLVRIARCLAQGASILILDEPASMLDPAHSRRIADALASLVESGKTLIYTTHDIGLVLFFRGSAVIISGGIVGWKGPVEDLHDPKLLAHTYGISFSNKEIPSVF